MKRSVSALYSSYIIDGVQMDYTPAQLLEDCTGSPEGTVREEGEFDSIVDEVVDSEPKQTVYDSSKVLSYMEETGRIRDNVKPDATSAPGSYAVRKLATALIDTLWKKGHFTLEDLRVKALWQWNCSPLGNMAAFYFSAKAVSRYLFDLDLKLDGYAFEKSHGVSDVGFETGVESAAAGTDEGEYDFFSEKETREMRYCWISDDEKCGHVLVPDRESWLIYIPFDTCEYRLGNSLFEKAEGVSGDVAPDIQDADYFMDCFEVIRELVEDGVIIAGTTVGTGGLASAAGEMCGETGIVLNTGGIERASGEKDILRILFAEVPGVLIQVRGGDYDYMDSQLLLQDIAYFPVGQPVPGTAGVKIASGCRSGVADILASLLQVTQE